MKKKILGAMLIFSMAVGAVVPVMAADVQSTQSFSETSTAACDVTVNGGASTFSVTIPKTITGSGSSGTLSYDVTVTGDFSGDEYVSVVPDNSVTLSQAHKDDVVASITQDKETWYVNELDTKGNGVITYDGIEAGVYKGTFNFAIGLVSESGNE